MTTSDGRLVLRVPAELAGALDAAAAKKLTTVSEYVRQAVLRQLREDGSAVFPRSESAPSKALLSEREAAELLGCAQGTLCNWRVQGGGPTFVKIGRRKIAYRPQDLDAFVNLRTSTAEYT